MAVRIRTFFSGVQVMNGRRRQNSCIRFLALIGSLIAVAPVQAGTIEGRARFEKIKGRPQMGYVELYETNLFLSPTSSFPTGPSRRLGTSYWSGEQCITDTNHTGSYCIDLMPAGRYSILVNQPLFFVAPKVVTHVDIPAAGTLHLDIELPIDFSTYFKNDWTATAHSTWYQTFIATGSGIRGVAFSYAGDTPSFIEVAILADNGNPDVRAWPVVATQIDSSLADVTDNWVRFRSADAPTIPGQRYAVRLMGVGASFQPYKRNKDTNSYTGGRAYDANGVAQNFDINVTVFSDNDGTSVTMNKRTQDVGALRDGLFASKWGHTFVANGTSLAAVDVWAAGAGHKWDLDFTWRVYPAMDPVGPTGPAIGPTKTTKAAYQSFGVGLHGVSYNPDEVPLVPGQTYLIEFAVSNPPPESPGFNPLVMDTDSYAQGMGYIWTTSGWSARPDIDLSMTILEYQPLGPILRVEPDVVNCTAFFTGNPPPVTFTIGNNGGGTFNYTIESDAAWLTTTPSSGSCASETDTIAINIASASLPRGSYTGTLTITAPEAQGSPKTVKVELLVTTVPPDFDGDTDVDMTDFGYLQNCFTGPGVPQTLAHCQAARLDPDDDVDQDDVALFINCLSGPGIIARPDCAMP